MDRNEDIEMPDQELTYAYQTNTWMSDLHPYIKNLRLTDLSLPGSHNAGMDMQIEPNDSYNFNQDYRIRTQLDNGIRVLDLRLRYFAGNGGGYWNKMSAFHSVKNGRSLDEIKSDVDHFLIGNPNEIVVLAIHKMEAWGNFQIPWEEYYKLFSGHYASRLLPRSAVNLTLEQIRKQYPGPRVILAAPSELWAGRDNTNFWDELPHMWAGSGFVDRDRLKTHITNVMSNPPDRNSLWSMSATVYSLGGPADINRELCEWYPTDGDWQRKSSVINFDWVTRRSNQLIHQCIVTNKLRGAPENFRGSLYGTNQATFTWSALPSVVKYEISKLGSGVVGSSQTTSITIAAPVGVSDYTVRAVYQDGTRSHASESVRLSPIPQDPPASPRNITYRLIRGNVTFNWDPVPTAVRYEVLENDVPIGVVAGTTITTGARYLARYNFAAINSSGIKSAYSETIVVDVRKL